MDRLYTSRKEQLVEWCRSIESYCITVDFWTEEHNGMHFGGISLHHIDDAYRLNVFILGCYPYDENDQKALTVRAFVENVLNEYGLHLDGDKYVMTDNENKMKCAFSSSCQRVGCSSHYLNKQLEHAFTSETIEKQLVGCDEAQTLFKHVKAMVNRIRRSHKQLKLSRKLQTYSETRFNGAFHMLHVFSIVYDELTSIISSSYLNDYLSIDKDFLQQICDFLAPFDEVIVQLSDTKRPNLHRVLPLRQYLINLCERKDDDPNGIQQLKTFLGEKK